MIITAEELMVRLAEGGLVPVDVRPRADWEAATLADAVSLNVYDYFIPESSEDGLARMAAGAKNAFRRLGLDGARKPVFFEAQTGMISPRGLWFHELAGFDGGLILNGGLDGWRAVGGEILPGTGAVDAIIQADADEGLGRAEFRRDLVASTEDVLAHRKQGADILDVRRLSEFEGTFLHPCCARPGRIPHAHFAFYEDMLRGGRYRPADEIRALAEAAGLSPGREVIAYCHRGARAATALYGLRMAGFERVRIYAGSWHEWAADAGLPIEIGPSSPG